MDNTNTYYLDYYGTMLEVLASYDKGEDSDYLYPGVPETIEVISIYVEDSDIDIIDLIKPDIIADLGFLILKNFY